MKIQIAFEINDLEAALSIANEIHEHVDLIEVGSLLIYKYGEEAIKRFKQSFPNKIIVADSKIIDQGKESAAIFCKSGADWITVMAGASIKTINTVATVAHELGKKVLLDLLDSKSLGQSALDAKVLGVDGIIMHRPHDETDQIVFADDFEMVKGNTTLPIFVSGKFECNDLDKLREMKVSTAIISKQITSSQEPKKDLESLLQQNNPCQN